MALYVNTNVSSLNAKRNLSNSTSSLDTTYKRLASGLRINSAKDDAAGLQISNRLTSQINGLEQGNRNAQDGISYAQTAEGAMDEITNMLQRVRTLALQSANGTNNAEDRIAIQQEVTQLCNEINRVSVSTTFGGTKILNGDGGITVAGTGTDAFKATGNKAGDKDIVFQVGADANQTIGVDLGLKNGAGFDIAGLTSNLTKADGTAFKQADITADGTGTFVAISAADSSTGKANVAFDVTTADSAQNVLAVIDKYVQTVDSKRAELGAVQNRLESTIRNQSNINENVSDARSRIRDTDFAVDTANMSQQNILQQASQTILSQANQRPQIALSLL